MTLPVFVVDTNVLVAGLITRSVESPVASVLDAMLSGTLVYLLSPALLAEYQAVLARPKLVVLHGLSASEVDQLLEEITANAILREPDPGAPAPDPGDDHLWALLESQPGAILLTGDRLLLEDETKGGAVLSPRSWMERFRTRGNPTAPG
ncbi:MAG: putative toxin-antitoxin system toxin component, PIN family [Ectothiorhodospiraceae bacterium]|nr:putative toxin-antitoxin system toxin component, PIN family [Ectothiorhodospiraceae bacterium]